MAPILHLNLKKEWFDLIADGKKKEEYREIKQYWNRIFGHSGVKIKGRYYHPKDIIVRFSNGYSKDRRQMDWTLGAIAVREGREEWGAEPGKQYYVLMLKENLSF